MPDGVRAPLIVKDTGLLYAGKYRHELVVTIRDWYNNQAPFLNPYYPSRVWNPSGAVSIPVSHKELLISIEALRIRARRLLWTVRSNGGLAVLIILEFHVELDRTSHSTQ